MNNLERVLRFGVIPVISIATANEADTVCAALVAGGLPVIEVVLRSPFALDAVRRLALESAITVGAGTIVSAELASRAIDAGAAYLVTPGLSETIAKTAETADIPLLPGISTATELLRAQELGFDTVKFFPASTSGGPEAILALSGPFPTARFVPTGGITARTAPEYLAVPSVAAVGGSWMIPSRDLSSGDVDALTQSVAQSVALSASR